MWMVKVRSVSGQEYPIGFFSEKSEAIYFAQDITTKWGQVTVCRMRSAITSGGLLSKNGWTLQPLVSVKA